MLLQSDGSGCGKAVVRNLLCLLFKNKAFYTAKLQTDCKSFYEIKKELASHGIFYHSYQVDDIKEIKKSMFPLICQMVQGDSLHFIIVKSIKKNKVKVYDPCFGEMNIELEEFLTLFTGNMMGKEKVGEREKAKSKSLLKSSEIFFYVCCFLFESASLVSLLLFSTRENSFLPSVLSILILLTFILLQNALNLKVRHRLENEYLLHHLVRGKTKADYPHLYHLITMTIKVYSNSISYAVLCVGVIVMLLLNSYYFSFLILVSILFYAIRLPLKEERNSSNRYCSMKEIIFLNQVEEGKEENAKALFLQMRKKSEWLLTTIILSWVFEAFSSMIFSLAIMNIAKIFSMNSFIFCVMMTLSFSYSLESVLKMLSYPEEKAKEMNALSSFMD